MRQFIKLGAAGVVGFATTTGVSAQALASAMGDPSDMLMLEETPLSTPELQEARGGFVFGGFDFEFGVDIGPVIQDPLPNGVFDEGGLFGEDGLFGDDGVFGEDGVFGDNGPAPDAATGSPPPEIVEAAPTTTVTEPSVAPPPAATTTTTETPAAPPSNTVSTPEVTTTQAPSTPPPPPAQTTVTLSQPTATPETTQSTPQPELTVAQAPPPDTGAAEATQSQPSGPQGETVLIQPNTTAPSTAPAVNDNDQTPQNSPTAPSPGGAQTGGSQYALAPEDEPEVAMTFSTGNNAVATVTQTIDPSGGATTLIFNNTMNGAFLRHTIDINVAIPNFDQRIDMAIAQSVTATIASTYGLLGTLN